MRLDSKPTDSRPLNQKWADVSESSCWRLEEPLFSKSVANSINQLSALSGPETMI